MTTGEIRKAISVICIVYYSEVIDNWGTEVTSSNGSSIFSILNNPLDWSDDMIFEDDNGVVYHIDDLIGKEVYIPNIDIGVFTVLDSEI
jgi:hypothetical protein